MKLLKTLTAGSLALALAASADAATYTVHLSGSSAFRKAVHVAIVHTLTGATAAYNSTGGKDLTNCNQAVFKGTIGADTYIIETSWAGSLSGVYNVTTNAPISTWMTDTGNTMSSVSVTGSATAASFTGGTGTTSPVYDGSNPAADIAMSDSFQSSTPFTSPTLVENVVGVVPFYWVVNKGASASITNVTPLVAQGLLSGGVPLSFLTGNSADASSAAVVIGRDEDSGTRVCAFAESGYGVFTTAKQYKPTASGGAITALVKWPSNTVNGVTYPTGDSGEGSGGNLATDLGNTISGVNVSGVGSVSAIVTYLGESDAKTLCGDGVSTTGLGGRYLTYNGVSFGAGAGLSSGDANFYQAIQQGKYTFWSYEHMYYRSSLAGGQLTYAGKLFTQIHDTDALVSGVRLTDMAVGRASEGAIVTAGSPY